MKHVLLACGLVLYTSTAIAAENDSAEKFTLRYKLKQGDVLRYSVEHQASVRSTIDGTTQQATTRSDSLKAWRVIDVMPSGEIEFMNIVERLRMTNQLPDRAEMIYDSEKDSTPPPGFEDAAKAVGVPLSIVRMTPWGDVLKREVKHHQPAADPDAPMATLLPEDPVAVGDTWDEPREVTVKLQDGNTKKIETRRHFKLKSVETGVAVIEATYQVLSPVSEQIEAQLAQRLLHGEIRFDIEAGKVLSQKMDVDKRVLGFAGATSSMHYVMRMEEKLVEKPTEVARKPE
ncbi:MAG: hypothetical protein WD851_05515 [Pirellulales bacterium]